MREGEGRGGSVQPTMRKSRGPYSTDALTVDLEDLGPWMGFRVEVVSMTSSIAAGAIATRVVIAAKKRGM